MKTATPSPPHRRVHALDELRGFCILLMVVYHAAYDLVYLFGVDIPAFHWPIVEAAQPFVAGIFIFISGIACRFSRNNLRRGGIALALGLAITAVTYFAMPNQAIWFGILHFLGTGMILFALLHPLLDRIPPALGMALAALLFLSTVRISAGHLGIPGLPGIPLPVADAPAWLLPFGIGGKGADYFPLLPWIFVFFAGTWCGVYFLRGQMPEYLYRSHLPWLSRIGQHTLLIYVLHQPVIYAVLWLFF